MVVRSVPIGAAVCSALALFASPAAALQPLGDLTADGSVTLADATRLWRIVLGLEAASVADSVCGDVAPRPSTGGASVGDGVLDTQDVDRVLDLLLGNLTPAQFHGVPSVSFISPPEVTPGDSFTTFSVFGVSLSSVSSLAVEPSEGVELSDLVVCSDGLLMATVAVDPGAAAGVRQIRVVSLGGTSDPGSPSELTVFPPSGPPPSLLASPDPLQLVVGERPSTIVLRICPTPAAVSSVSASSQDGTIASVAATMGMPAGEDVAMLAVSPVGVGSTQITGSWEGQPFSVGIDVAPPAFLVTPETFYLYQEGLTDTLFLRITRQTVARTVALSSSDGSIVSVPSSVTIPAGADEVAVEVTPANNPGIRRARHAPGP